MRISSRSLVPWLLCVALAALPAFSARAQLVQKTAGYEGGTRSWLEHVPASYDGSKPVPLVVALHGAFNDAAGFAPDSGWIAESDVRGFIVVFPNGDGSGTALTWHDWIFDGSKPDDIGFLAKVIAKVSAEYRIDATRVYMTGFSDGGDMTSFFATARGDLLAGISPWAGDWSTSEGQADSQLHPTTPVPEWLWRGTEDNSDPGPVSLVVQDQQQTNFWINLAHDDTTPQVSVLGAATTSTYAGGQAEVRFTSVAGLGHSVASEWATRTWDEFFARFARVNGAVVNVNGTLPAVKVQATVPKVHASSGTNAIFLFTLDRAAVNDLTLDYQLAGTGTNGVDYRLLGNTVTLPAGTASKKVHVHPLGVASAGGKRTVLLTLLPGGSYTVDGPATAKVKIIED